MKNVHPQVYVGHFFYVIIPMFANRMPKIK